MQEQSKTKSVHCVRDLRDVPATAYRLPSEGRAWLHNSCQRQRLAMLLATYADGDGSRVRPSRKTLAHLLSCSVRTVQTLLNDLETLGVQRKVGLHGESGNAVRQLNVAALRAGVQSTPEQECKVREQECRVQEQECRVQEQECKVQEQECSVGLHTTDQLLTVPPKPPPPPTGGGGRSSLEKQHLATIGKWSRKSQETVDAYLREHDEADVSQAMAAAINAGDLETAKSKSGAVIQHRMPEYLAKVTAERAAAAGRASKAKTQAEFIEQQVQCGLVQDNLRGLLRTSYWERLSADDRAFIQPLTGFHLAIEVWCKYTEPERERARAMAALCSAEVNPPWERAEQNLADFFDDPPPPEPTAEQNLDEPMADDPLPPKE